MDLEDDSFVVCFMEDGKSLHNCKAFKYNLFEKLNVYSKPPPVREETDFINKNVVKQNPFNSGSSVETIDTPTNAAIG